MRNPILLCLLLMVLSGSGLRAAPPEGAAPETPRRPGRNSMVWRAFSMLDDEKREQMTRLQRQNPEEFQKQMLALAEQQRQAMVREIAEQKELIAAWRKAPEGDEKEALRARLATKLRNEFTLFLTNHRRMIRDTEKRLEKLRAELKLREENSGKIVEARLEALLSGKAEPGAPPPRREREPEHGKTRP